MGRVKVGIKVEEELDREIERLAIDVKANKYELYEAAVALLLAVFSKGAIQSDILRYVRAISPNSGKIIDRILLVRKKMITA